MRGYGRVARSVVFLSVVAMVVASAVVAMGVSGATGGIPRAGLAFVVDSGNGASSLALPSGKIVFTSFTKASQRPSLYVMDSDGSHMRLLVRNAAEAAVSPDGRRVAFVRGGEIWTMRRDGTDQRHVTAGRRGWGEAGAPAWSPDRRTLYFFRSLKGDGDSWEPAIFSIHTDGTALARVTNGGCDVAPAPSPDGRLAYVTMGGTRDLDCVEGRGGALYAVSASGRPAKLPFRIADGWNYDPAWSPDGRRLAYMVMTNVGDVQEIFEYGIYVSASDGSRPRRLPTPKRWPGADFWDTVECSAPAWSADGRQLAFEMDGDIWVVRQDGTQLRQLTTSGGDEPAWL